MGWGGRVWAADRAGARRDTMVRGTCGDVEYPIGREGQVMVRGTVKWFDSEKGFGFISPDEGGPDVFVEYTAVEGDGFRSLVEGQRVEFEVRRTKPGPEAVIVRVVATVTY
ncbi:hypothetical protein GCM10010198_44240 [Nocardia seriolae]